MSECPKCGMRDDDWFLCHREGCATKVVPAKDYATLEAEVSRLTALLDEAKVVANAANRLLDTFDELRSTTTAERIITGRSEASIRAESNAAISDLYAARAFAEKAGA